MRDYWNDPPEAPEAPQCCGDFMTVEASGAAVCPTCRRRIDPPPDPEPPEDVSSAELPGLGEALRDRPHRCPHGNAWEHCDPCDRAGDFAFDANRERSRR